MGRIMAIDYGQKRCGIAVTDPLRIIASGLTTVPTHTLPDFLMKYFESEPVDILVVGEPKDMKNIASESERFITPFLNMLRKKYPSLKVERIDERFTSMLAFEAMISGGVKKMDRRNKETVDMVSATIILQSYIQKLNSNK